MIRSKKAAVSDGAVLFVAIVVYVFVYIIFYFIFSQVGLSIEDELVGKNVDLDTEMVLRNYLRTPVPTSNGNEIVADILYAAVETGDTKQLTNVTSIVLQPYSGRYWRVEVYTTARPEEDQYSLTRVLSVTNEEVSLPYTELSKATVQIPHPNKEKYPALAVMLEQEK